MDYPLGRNKAFRQLQGIFQKRGIVRAYLFGSQQEEGMKLLSGKKFKADRVFGLEAAKRIG